MQHFTAKEINRINQGLPPWESMSFACGGWLQFYMFGVAKALQSCNLVKGVKYYGCSAGALTAAGLAMDGEFEDAIQFCKDYCVPKAYSDLSGLFRLSDYVTKCMELTLLHRFEQLPPETLNVSITRLPFFSAERVSNFSSKEDLLTALLASSAAFPFASLVKRDGNWYIDGGLSDFQPIQDDETIMVSPFYFSDCHIKPSRYIPLWWTFMPPRSKDTIDWLYNLGWEDCMTYIKSRNIPIQVPHGKEEFGSLKQVDHPFNIRKKVSIHRFFGYDLSNMAGNYVSFVLDFFLLVLLLVIWKPFALGMIYLELFLRIGLLLLLTFIYSLWALYPPNLLQRFVARPYFRIISYFIGVSILQQSVQQQKSQQIQRLEELWECVTCVASLSLLLRFVSGPPSEIELRKHNKLAKNSIVYRVFRHMI